MSDQSAPFLDRVRETIAAHNMLGPDDRVLVAVSGGPDSVSLLYALRELGYDVVVAHLDHMSRGGESADDAEFVEQLADELDVPFVLERRDIEALEKLSPDSFEQAARKARYFFFGMAAAKHECKAIATGHTADDVAETVLWRMLRGTSVDGIGGIPPIRPLSNANVVRPFIHCGRSGVLDFATNRSIHFRCDSSNEDRRFLRNRIRHDLLPLLERDYNPKVKDALVRLATLARDDSAIIAEAFAPFWEACREHDEGLSINREAFLKGSQALQRRFLKHFAHHRNDVDPTFERTEAARQFILTGRTGAKLDLGGLTLVNTRTSTEIHRVWPPQAPKSLAVPGVTVAFGRQFAARLLDSPQNERWSTYCTPSRQVFDADILGETIRIRSREPGDRFTPLGMNGSRKLQDYFVDEGVPRDERDRVPIVVVNDRIAWIVGGAVDAAFAVSEGTKRVAELEVTDAAE